MVNLTTREQDHDAALSKVPPWVSEVANANRLNESIPLKLWQYYIGIITNLRPKEGGKAAEFVSETGIITTNGYNLIKELRVARMKYLKSFAKPGT